MLRWFFVLALSTHSVDHYNRYLQLCKNPLLLKTFLQRAYGHSRLSSTGKVRGALFSSYSLYFFSFLLPKSYFLLSFIHSYLYLFSVIRSVPALQGHHVTRGIGWHVWPFERIVYVPPEQRQVLGEPLKRMQKVRLSLALDKKSLNGKIEFQWWFKWHFWGSYCSPVSIFRRQIALDAVHEIFEPLSHRSLFVDRLTSYDVFS